ncbi:MAG: hypothetical protein AB7K24_29650 [Gemmataceae bacterium]
MGAARAKSLINGWETIRYELLNTRIRDLDLRLDRPPIKLYINKLYRELDAKGLRFRPDCYLTDAWGCPDGVPIIGIPFYLADERLQRIEEEQTGWVENEQMIRMLMRHEAGHAFNYAYKLYTDPEWAEVFGNYSKPYRDSFRPNPFSRCFVRHIVHHQHGKTYAQKHPDEDFAETFAVWLTPRSAWRRKYRYWPALHKLQYVDEIMHSIRRRIPLKRGGRLHDPIHKISDRLVDHYGQKLASYREEAQGYVDDKLREVFPAVRANGTSGVLVSNLLRKHRRELISRVAQWSELPAEDVRTILLKLEERADFLCLQYRRKDGAARLLDLTALATSLAMDFAYTGRLTG